MCGQTRACAISQVTGQPWCASCRRWRARCAGCGTVAPVYAGTRERPLCARCSPDPGSWKRCPACQQTWQLGTRPCQQCALRRKITGRLSDGTGTISSSLVPLHHALTIVERPSTVRTWLDLPPVRTLLTSLSQDPRPLTHEILDEFPASSTLAHLRTSWSRPAPCPAVMSG